MRRYVHHGAPNYDPERFQAVNNGGYHNKPKGGLWLSPVDAEKGWENWCQLAEHPVYNAGQLTPVLKYRAWRVTPPIST